jgi:hypothetical protein
MVEVEQLMYRCDILNTVGSACAFRVAEKATGDVSTYGVFLVWHVERAQRKQTTKTFDFAVLALRLCRHVYLSSQKARESFFLCTT